MFEHLICVGVAEKMTFPRGQQGLLSESLSKWEVLRGPGLSSLHTWWSLTLRCRWNLAPRPTEMPCFCKVESRGLDCGKLLGSTLKVKCLLEFLFRILTLSSFLLFFCYLSLLELGCSINDGSRWHSLNHFTTGIMASKLMAFRDRTDSGDENPGT